MESVAAIDPVFVQAPSNCRMELLVAVIGAAFSQEPRKTRVEFSTNWPTLLTKLPATSNLPAFATVASPSTPVTFRKSRIPPSARRTPRLETDRPVTRNVCPGDCATIVPRIVSGNVPSPIVVKVELAALRTVTSAPIVKLPPAVGRMRTSFSS